MRWSVESGVGTRGRPRSGLERALWTRLRRRGEHTRKAALQSAAQVWGGGARDGEGGNETEQGVGILESVGALSAKIGAQMWRATDVRIWAV